MAVAVSLSLVIFPITSSLYSLRLSFVYGLEGTVAQQVVLNAVP